MSVTFEEVMGFHPANREVYEEIRDNLGQLLPFVGSELIEPIYGTWEGTLFEIGRKLTDDASRAKLKSLIEDGNLLDAAQLLEDERGAVNLQQDLVHHYSPNRLDDNWEAVMDSALWLLPGLFRCPVLTTNLDQSIETIYNRQGFDRYEVLNPTDIAQRIRAERMRKSPCVFKLHGTASEASVDYDKLVITKAQYRKHYGERGDVREALSTFVDRRCMLFLGCDLDSNGFVSVLKDDASPGVIHYAVATCKCIERDQRVREHARAHIRAILYEKGRPESLRVVLEELLKELNPESYKNLLAETRRPRELSAAEQELVSRINARLLRQQKGHPSFQLMNDSFNSALLPNGEETTEAEPIPNSERDVTSGDGKTVRFGDFIRRSWDGEQAHLFITGRGGVGKTVALLSFATEPGFLPRDVPAVYIPLYDLSQYADAGASCIDKYLERAFSEEERNLIGELSHEPWKGGPNVILLLDGHNEIPSDRVRNVDLGIRAWAERCGVQLVTTSRVAGLFGVAETRWLELQGLPREVAEGHLRRIGADVPDGGNTRLWRLLETPLMLRRPARDCD